MVVALRRARDVAAQLAPRLPYNAVEWDGHPAASDAWLRAAAQVRPRQRWAVLGTLTDPWALLVAHPPAGSVVLQPLGHHHGGFQHRVGASPVDVVSALVEVARRRIGYLPFCTSRMADAVRAVAPQFILRTHDVAPIVEAEDVEHYISTRHRKLRATFRQAKRALCAKSVEITMLPAGDFSKHCTNIAAVEAAGHRKNGYPLSGRHASFIRRALVELDADGVLEVWVGRTRQAALGYLVSCRSATNTYFYTMGIRREAATLSLGTAIFHGAITSALARGLWVNLGPGDTLFKRRFATHQHTLYDVLLMSSRMAPLARRLLQALPSMKHGGPWV